MNRSVEPIKRFVGGVKAEFMVGGDLSIEEIGMVN
jgi:hypothetical protein